MPETDSLSSADIVFVYTNIGRGHPSYIDGIVETLKSKNPEINYFVTDVFSSGTILTRLAWLLIRQMYQFGSRGGMVTRFYNRLRDKTGGGESSRLLKIVLGCDLRKMLLHFSGPVLVAHPLLASILNRQNRVIYQHGELVFPIEAAVGGCTAILVPTQETKNQAIKFGIEPARIIVTGQALEAELCLDNESVYSERLNRYKSRKPLCVALFSSGAYPPDHLDLLWRIVCSLSKSDMKLYLFTGSSVRKLNWFKRKLKKINYSDSLTGPENIHLISSSSREDENIKVAKIFRQLDCFIAPAHERTNWAVGLGLPMLILTPHIGSYAPLNARYAINQEVACEIHSNDADEMVSLLTGMRSTGELARMSRSGYHSTDISGFKVAADYLIQASKQELP